MHVEAFKPADLVGFSCLSRYCKVTGDSALWQLDRREKMVILDLKSYEDFVSTVPAAGSVETKEQCIALLKGWVAYGKAGALGEKAPVRVSGQK